MLLKSMSTLQQEKRREKERKKKNKKRAQLFEY